MHLSPPSKSHLKQTLHLGIEKRPGWSACLNLGLKLRYQRLPDRHAENNYLLFGQPRHIQLYH